MMTYSKLQMEIKEEFPDFSIKPKGAYWFMHVLNFFLKVLTFGRMKTFLTQYTTVIGTTVYVPSKWVEWSPTHRMAVLRHERVHMRQKRRMGSPLFFLRYTCWPLPILFAKGRRDLEMEAYEETMRALSELQSGKLVLTTASYKEAMVKRFTGPAYLWTWVIRKDIEKWYDEAADRLIKDG